MVHGLADPLVPNHSVVNSDGMAALDRVYPKNGDQWVQSIALGDNAEQFSTILPGRYSGEMCKVVQDNLSRGWRIPYTYTFNKTNGIFTATNGDKYVLEITSSAIRAWPLLIGEGEGTLSSLDYDPLLSPDPQDNTVINMTVPGLLIAYQKSPFFPECGWAFSEDGHRACNVVVASETHPEDGRLFDKSYLYEITITEAGNRPLAATISEMETEWLHGNRVTHFKYPDYPNNSLISFDWFRGIIGEPLADDGGDWDRDAPIHAWYEGEELIVCRYRTQQTVEAMDDPENPHGFPTACGGSTRARINPRLVSEGSGTTYTFGRTTTTYSRCFSSPVYDDLENINESSNIKLELKTGKDFGDTWVSQSNASDAGLSTIVKPVTEYYIEVTCSGHTTQSNVDVLVIPLNDRQSILHYRTRSSAEQSDRKYTTANSWWLPSTYTTEACGFVNTGRPSTESLVTWYGEQDITSDDGLPVQIARSRFPRRITGVTGSYGFTDWEYTIHGTSSRYRYSPDSRCNPIQIPAQTITSPTLDGFRVALAAYMNSHTSADYTSVFTPGTDRFVVSCNGVDEPLHHIHTWNVTYTGMCRSGSISISQESTGAPRSTRTQLFKSGTAQPAESFTASTDESSTSETTEGEESASVIIQGESIALENPEGDPEVDDGDWQQAFDLFIMPPAWQRFIVAADYSETVSPIYTANLVPQIPLEWIGPDDYPQEELEGILPSWLGNP